VLIFKKYFLDEGMKFCFSQTDNGWQTTETFWAYLKKVDEEQRARGVEGPYVMFADGYPAHMSLKIYMWARERGIIYVILYPNATHILQPLDVAVFKALKSRYIKEVTDYKFQHNLSELDEVDFIKILSRAIHHSVTPEIIKNGFRATGIYPLDRNAVRDDRLLGVSVPRLQLPSVTPNEPSTVPSSTGQSSTLPSSTLPSSTLPSSTSSLPNRLDPHYLIHGMRDLNEQLKELIQSNDGSSTLASSMIDKFLDTLKKNFSSDSTSVAEVATQSQPLALIPALDPAVVEILQPPPENKKKRHRQMKVDASGCMNDDEMEEKRANRKKARDEELKELEDRKKIRLDKQQKKKEEAEAKAKRGLGRGRPRKTL
jgi:hypothetical protein